MAFLHELKSKRLLEAVDPQDGERFVEDMMQKVMPAADPDAYVQALSGWQRDRVETLRAAVRTASGLDEVVKWGHLVYLARGPVLLIRAEKSRVLLGFWRGQRLRSIEQRLKPGGKYEMARLEIHETTVLEPVIIVDLTNAAIRLNQELGDPTKAVRRA